MAKFKKEKKIKDNFLVTVMNDGCRKGSIDCFFFFFNLLMDFYHKVFQTYGSQINNRFLVPFPFELYSNLQIEIVKSICVLKGNLFS